ncbi:1-aminocyclopropane-1-carboxylate deaminase/D-cysteine desulfhydrase [Paraflavitalea pollutisoli]|uniref:1-aminocyclopropane-1-carboxylate deaminase/D-cysteine desulfhydrase n=1 Tax=Paraflavitalea pollutisoli TaxID=3034143 RepID=UPI0023ED7F34|nr:pyridoxal-phosphate dependent enzyme [Paraflavitalea sp. H1-2-19X]
MITNNTYQTVDCAKAITQSLTNPPWQQKVTLDVLRLDLVHPVLSGNKWFKLKFYLQEALQQHKKGILTLGGAWSNHLVAVAIAGQQTGLATVGVVRGEPSGNTSATLQEAKRYGMELQYVSRQEFRDEKALFGALQQHYPDYLLVPAGGQGEAGIEGATEILALAQGNYTHIACGVGTGTMIAGLARAASHTQTVVGITSLKIADQHHNSLQEWISLHAPAANYQLVYDYHFGGYARKTEVLLDFMNELYRRYTIPTDFVYTGKLLYGLFDLIGKDFFPPESRILAIQSGGLQGNRSLPPGRLIF